MRGSIPSVSIRRRAHDWGLVFATVVGVYLVSVVLAARLARALAAALGSSPTVVGRVLLGALALDLSKLPALLLGALLTAAATKLGPLALALGLTLGSLALEVAVSAALGQAPWLVADPLVLGCRLLVVGLLAVVVRLVIVRRRRRAGGSGEAARTEGARAERSDQARR
jgi:hypothetical protein